MSNPYTQLYVSQISISKIYATNKGGVFYIEKGDYLSLVQVQLSNVLAQEGSMLYSIAAELKINIQKSSFICQNNFNMTAVQNSLDTYHPDLIDGNGVPTTYLQESIFYIQSAISTVSNDNVYSNCFVNQDGGVFTLIQTIYNDTASEFSNNAAINGGAINCNECNISLVGSQFQYNYGYMGGVIFLQKNAYLLAQFTVFQFNKAYRVAGVIYATQLSYFNIYNSKFYKNVAYQSSAIEIFGGSLFSFSTINSTTFIQNYAGNSFTIKMDQASMALNRVSMLDNNATRRTKNIFTVFSTLYVFESNFTFTQHNYTIDSNYLNVYFGGFINLGVASTMVAVGSRFINGEAYSGGAIYVSSESQLNLTSCFFINNQAKTTGGAIFAQQSFDVFVLNNTYFTLNNALLDGDHIYFTDAFAQQLYLDGPLFTSPNATTSAIYVENVKQVIVNSTTAKNIVNPIRSTTPSFIKGGFLYCINCAKINISYSTFTNISAANYGGVLYVTMQDVDKNENGSIPLAPTYTIQNSYFNTCVADEGGVVYNDNSDYFQVKDSIFKMNLATSNPAIDSSGTAGCLYYYCNKDVQQCKFELVGNNNFTDNYAELQGGVIHWQLLEVLFNTSQTYFRNNSALIYGDDVSCVPQRLVLIQYADYIANQDKCINAEYFIQNKNTLRRLESSLALKNDLSNEESCPNSLMRILQTSQNFDKINTTIFDQRSGGFIPETYLAVVDMFGRIVSANQQSKLTMYVDNEYLNDPYRTKYAPILQGNTIFYSQNGSYNISGTQFTGAPLSNYTLHFLTDAIDLSIPSNKAFLKAQKLQQIDFKMGVDLRVCMPGEMFSSSGQCQLCEANKTFSLAQQSSPGSCIQCPVEQAICMGGNQIGPQPGYWRSNNMSDVFYKCFNADACLGMLPPNYNQLGDCAEGYEGKLCSECILGWSRTSSMGDTFICKPCPNPTSNGIKLGVVMFGYVIIVILMVRSTLMGAKSKKNVTSIYLKIALNHVQLLQLIQTLNFKFPSQVTSFFSSTGSAASSINPAPQILSLDCYLDTRTSAAQTLPIPMYYEKMIIIALLPILVSIIIFVVWASLQCFYEKRRVQTLGEPWQKEIKQLNYLIAHGDKTEQDIATHQKKALLQQSKYPILGRIISTLIILLFFLHPTIVQYAISDFSCMDIDGVNLLKPDLTIECKIGVHKFFTYAVALPCIVLWGLGIPFFALIMLVKNKNVLNKIETKEKLGFLYNGYKRELFFWEIVIMYRKIVVIFVSVFLESYGVVGQALVVFAILILFLALSIQFRPFTIDGLNDLETLSIITQIITIYCGFFYITNVSDILSSDQSLTTSTKEYIMSVGIMLGVKVSIFLFIVIIFANAMFFIYWGLKMMIEVKYMIIAKVPKIYVCLFLCNDFERFKSQQRKQQVRETNELLREEYERTLKRLLSLNDSGKLVLTDNLLERINVYLDERRFMEGIGYLKNEKLNPREQKRVEREKDNLDKKNKFLSNLVYPEKQQNQAMYKDYNKKDMLQIDQNLLEEGYIKDENMSLNSIVEETKEPIMGELYTGGQDQNLWSDDQMMKSDDNKLQSTLKFGKTVRNEQMNRPKWELDYLRRRRGSLKDNEVEDELWGDETTDKIVPADQKPVVFEEEKGESNQMINNFIIPLDMDQEQLRQEEEKKGGNGEKQSRKEEDYLFLQKLDEETDVRQIVQANSGIKNQSQKQKVKQMQKEQQKRLKESKEAGGQQVRQKEKQALEEVRKKEIERKIDENLIIEDLEKSFDKSDEDSEAVVENIKSDKEWKKEDVKRSDEKLIARDSFDEMSPGEDEESEGKNKQRRGN